ncbi:aldo-keto reductase family 1 member B1-like isoform X2 [Bicyclus anynana]|uniref:Aldo-keto reductase family 1 member B1-like isoform X2 n=1 Tax=Bicyclus anynana TaxID=110368 RepID=A0ABM3M418_BICAN|nr:aldo-keto reductase family 1 member B1-like isoform X2 [Bicyclus anynana]
MVKVPVIKLSNGKPIPQLGLGTWQSKPGEVVQAVKDAIDIGYRHIDCAFVYGNEPEVGEAISAKIAEGVVKREDLFITSKLWNTFHRPDLVRGALLKTLQNLKLDYLDLYLIHWPQAYKEEGELFPADADGKIQFSDVDYLDTWRALEPLAREGLARSLGLSNFNSKQVERVLQAASVKPVVNQVECHPYLNQKRLQEFCEARGIKLTAYSPLGSPDRPWAKPGEPQLMDDPKLQTLAARLGKTVAQILIRYQIERGIIVIPKSVTRSRILSNYQVLDFALAPEDVTLIDSFHCNGRLVPMTASLGHKYHPFENDEF